MEENLVSHHHRTIGGIKGHLLRRGVHVSVAALPIIYYYLGSDIVALLRISMPMLVLSFVAFIVLLEILRLVFGWRIFGQRQHEAKQISSFAWGTVTIGIVLLFSPGRQYAIPIIWSCAFIDPLLGELRALNMRPLFVFAIGVVAVMLIWLIATGWLGTPWCWILLMGPVTILAEWPTLPWLDDNALMQLVPLVLVLLLK